MDYQCDWCKSQCYWYSSLDTGRQAIIFGKDSDLGLDLIIEFIVRSLPGILGLLPREFLAHQPEGIGKPLRSNGFTTGSETAILVCFCKNLQEQDLIFGASEQGA